MLTIVFIIFREVLEIFLFLSILLAATKNLRGKFLAIFSGFLIGILGSICFGLVITEVSDLFEGRGQEIFEICILLLSIIFIFITINWVQGNKKANHFKLKESYSNNKELLTLSLMIGVIILREGIEIFLFVYGAILTKQLEISQIIMAIILAIAISLPINLALYFGLLKIPYKYLFKVTTIILTLLAAGMAARIGNLLIATDLVSYGVYPLWDSSSLISNNSLTGEILHNIFGYDAQPNLIEVLMYLGTILIIKTKKLLVFLKKS